MADKFWPDEDPIGKRFGQGSDLKTYYTVVGVIGNIRSFGLAAKSPYEFYRTTDQVPSGAMTVVLRSSGVEPSVAHSERARHRRQPRSEPAGHRRADDGGGGERVGGAAAPAVGAVGAVRRAWRDCWRWSACTA